jgi:hypothetical protein
MKNVAPYFFFLTVLFIVLKLTGQIAWSWWLVTLPIWVFPAIGLVFFAALLSLSFSVLCVSGLLLMVSTYLERR